MTGGIIGSSTNSRVIGCSFSGILKGGINTGGIIGNGYFSYINMCYAISTFKSASAGGLLGGSSRGTSGVQPQDTLINSYAYVLEPENVQSLSSVFDDTWGDAPVFVINNCFSNAGATQTGATMYSTATELNGLLANFTVSNLPQGITAPPANKPFKAGADPAKPAVLWWE